MKKLVSLVLALLMVFGIASSLAEIEMTTEEITLTYAAKEEDYDLTCQLADQFMQQYPNITVEVLEMDESTYDTSIGNLAAEQKLPDVFWMSNVCDAVANGWALQLDEFYANDPDAAKISPTILKYAQIGGRRYSVPAKSRPIFAVINKTLFETYNVEIPSPDWTFEEFKAAAEATAHPENYHFGYGHNTTVEYFIPRFNWDGESYTLDETWIMMEELMADWTARKVAENMTPEEKLAVWGDEGTVAKDHGACATIMMSFEWGAEAFIDGSMEQQTGCEYLIYPVPSPLDINPTDMMFACISRGTQYPNEAWMLAKWMTWGAEATILRNTWYNENEILTNALPMIEDEAVWADTKAKVHPALQDFVEYAKPMSPSIDSHAPNCIWVNVNYYFGGVPGKFASGETTPADMAPELRDQYNKLRDDWFAACSDFATATDLEIAE